MPSLTATLEDAIHRAISFANERRHELATLEHLLLALVDEPDAARVMRVCSVDLGELRTNLTRFLDTELETLRYDSDGSEAAPSTGFQRAIQRAATHVQSAGRSEVTGANVLVAIFNERESHAAFFLQVQDMTLYDAVNYLSHGIAKDPTDVYMSQADVRKMVAKARAKGYITYDELNRVLPSDQFSSDQIEDVMSLLSEMGVNVVESE